MAKKRRRKATRRPAAAAAAPKRRRRRTSNPAKRRRRSSPRMGTGINAITADMRTGLGRLIGKLATAWAVRRWSQSPGGIFGTAHTSPTAGEGWSLPQYAIAGAVAMWGPALLRRFVNPSEFRRGAVDLMLEKLVWTEGLARSQWAQNAFGTGDVGYNGSSGQTYVQQGNRWNAMQGLVAASPLDGLVEASALDGDPSYSYGHLLPSGVSADTTKFGKHSGSGYTSQVHAAYS